VGCVCGGWDHALFNIRFKVLEPLKLPFRFLRGCLQVSTRTLVFPKGTLMKQLHFDFMQRLRLKPFTHKLHMTGIYDNGTACSPVPPLEICHDQSLKSMQQGVRNIEALSLELSHPMQANVPQFLQEALRNLDLIAYETGYSFWRSQEIEPPILTEDLADLFGRD
jgi:large subunit ribosomal protein LP0